MIGVQLWSPTPPARANGGPPDVVNLLQTIRHEKCLSSGPIIRCALRNLA